ncbi:TonB-dependent receptor plug domain-containing protein [Maricaulaceae bacterium MS644]
MRNFKSGLTRTTILAGFTGMALSGAAFAQAEEGETEASQADTITVTGSRIVREDFTGSAPVVSVDAENIQNSGATNLTNFLQDFPALVNSFDSQDSADTGNSGSAGLNLLNLRNLGTERTLVLVDGRRHVAQSEGSASVDINTIPVGLVERVEVLTGGASAVYGADGVSGVVNFVLRDTYVGDQVRAQVGTTEAGGADNVFVSALSGRDFLDGRLNLTLAAEYAHDTSLNARDRDFLTPGRRWTLVDNPAELNGDDPNVVDRIFVRDARYIDTARGGLVYTDFSGVPGDLAGTGINFEGNGDVYRPGQYTGGFITIGGSGTRLDDFVDEVLPENERVVLNSTARYDLTPNHALFGELKYVETNTGFQGQPTFDYFIPIAGDAAFMPDSIRASAGGGTVFMGRDNFDLGFTGTDIQRQTLRAVAGLEGEFDVLGGLTYEASYVYGRTEAETDYYGDRLEDRFLAAIDSVVDPATGEIVCRSDLDPTAVPGGLDPALFGTTFTPGANSGCVPANVFGENISPEAAAWITDTQTYRDEIEQSVFQAFLAGDSEVFFSLPGGPVEWVLGAEYREEESRAFASDIEKESAALGQDISWIGQRTDSSGSFDVTEFFGEIEAPVLAGLPFIEELTIDAAYRWSDYSTAGQTDTWKVGGIWRINEQVMLRGTVAQAVRAPNITNLFLPQTQTFAFVADPCDRRAVDQGTDLRFENCQAILGVDLSTFEDTKSSTVEGRVGGNPNLVPETADTVTYGVVFTPSFIEGLQVAVDYYDIELEDAILSVSPQALAEQCVDLPLPNQFCDLVSRDPATGQIDFFDQFFVNVGSYTTSGVDFSARYLNDPRDFGMERDIGTFTLSLAGSHLESLTLQDLPDSEPDEQAGDAGYPEWQATADVTWNMDRWTVNYGTNWYDETRRFDRNVTAGDPDIVSPEFIMYDQRWTHDVQVRYGFTDAIQLYAGVNNLGNQLPDIGTQQTPVGALGRSYYAGVSAEF